MLTMTAFFSTWLALLAASVVSAQSNNASFTTPLYRNANASVDARVADLLKRMTIQEKTAQLIQGDIANFLNTSTGAFNASGLQWNMEHRAGQIWAGRFMAWESLSAGIKTAQDYLAHNTSLGIPAFIQGEGLHGLTLLGATIFNSPLGHACSFNPDLVGRMAAAIGREAAALGFNNLFAPLGDLARELRFGRVEETYGEDAYLAGEMAAAYVTGLQAQGVAATVKHFAAFSSPEQGLNTGPVHGGPRELYTTYLPPFKRAIIDAGAHSVMSGYHAYDGMPAVASRELLTRILRDEWGFRYWVTSDAGGTDRLCKSFKLCTANPIDADAITRMVLTAGGDVEMGGGSYSFARVPDLVAAGALDVAVVDAAVARVLRSKFELGLFERPFAGVPAAELAARIRTPDHLRLARQLDTESIVLLENRGGVLPLSKTARVAVIGPMAHGYVNYGDYVAPGAQAHGVTPLDGIRNASRGAVTYAKGCERWSNDESGFAEAVAAARAAEVAVVVVGTWSRDQDELWRRFNATTGEHIDASDLRLVGAMPRLVAAVIATGRPTVVVYSSGKPVTEPWISRNASALVQQFYPSEEGGHALAAVLFGDANPSGRLAVGFPYDVGTAPAYYDYLNSGRAAVDPGVAADDGSLRFGSSYVLASPLPLYEFGFGRSYSAFAYSGLRLAPASAPAAGNATVAVSVDVTNTSGRDGAEVVQLYVRDVIASVVVPNLQLRAFAKVDIAAGQTKTVVLRLRVAELGLWDINMKYVVEPGDFTVFVGSSSRDLRANATLTVV